MEKQPKPKPKQFDVAEFYILKFIQIAMGLCIFCEVLYRFLFSLVLVTDQNDFKYSFKYWQRKLNCKGKSMNIHNSFTKRNKVFLASTPFA